MNKTLLQIVAFAIGIATAVAAFNILKKVSTRTVDADRLRVIGEIQSVEGQVERRLPRTLNMESVPGPRPLYNQDLIVTQRKSNAVLILTATGTTLRLNENSRLIAETDGSRPGAMIATLLDGTLTVLNPGTPNSFRLFREGHEIKPSDAEQKVVPVIPGPGAHPSAPEATSPGLTITATQADESVKESKPAPEAKIEPEAPEHEETSDVLTNDDIIRQLKGATGFFQRCYLNYLHRIQPGTPGAVSGGTVTVSFTVQSSGKTADAKVVRSDFKDSTLNNCVTEVIERTVMKGFKGNPVPVTEFPITLQ